MGELHFSHNKITVDGAEAIVSAATEARKENQSPLWCRLEQNDVKEPDKVIERFEKEYPVLAVRQRIRGPVDNIKVHFPHFEFQRGCEPPDREKGKGKGRDKDRGDRWEDKDWRRSERGNDWKRNDWDSSWDRGGGKDRDGGKGSSKGKNRDGYDRDRWGDRDGGDRGDRRPGARLESRRSPPPRRQAPVRAKSEEAPPRPKRKLGVASGMFLRAMGAALADKKKAKK